MLIGLAAALPEHFSHCNFTMDLRLASPHAHLMSFENELIMSGRVLLAAIVGGLLGWEREVAGRAAGIRTFAAVCIGACIFGLLDLRVTDPPHTMRIAAQVASGIGFLGAGVIIRDRGNIRGLTTAATLWSTASIGIAIAAGLYVLTATSTAILLALLWISHSPAWTAISPKKHETVKRQRENGVGEDDDDDDSG